MKRVYPEVPLVAVAAVVRKNDSVLLIKRNNEPNKGKWTVPGGLVHLGERMEDAAIREVEEEVSLKVQLDGVLEVAENISRDENQRVLFHYVIIDYLAHPVSGEEKKNEEVADLRWVKKNEFAEYELTDTSRRLLKKIGMISE